MIEELLLGLDSDKPRIRYGAANAMAAAAQIACAKPHFSDRNAGTWQSAMPCGRSTGSFRNSRIGPRSWHSQRVNWPTRVPRRAAMRNVF